MSDETKKYKTTLPYYRDGVYYERGSIVEIPADETPSITWLDPETDEPVVVKKRLDVGVLSEEEKALILELRGEKVAAAVEKVKAKKAPAVPPPAKAEDKGRASDKDAI